MEIEEICLQCGVDVFDGRPYCSQECELLDASSTSSSSFSSPHFSPAPAGHLPEVPALMPAALGTALRSATRYDRYAWSSISDEDDERIHIHDDSDTKAANPFGLMYARRPSGTNKPSTVAPTAPRRYPSTSEDEGTGSPSPVNRSPRSPQRLHLSPKATPHTGVSPHTALADSMATITNPKRRNRASLPAYFQLLTVSPPAQPAVSVSQAHRASPSSLRTPTALLPASPPSAATAVAPPQDTAALRGRGRKREPGELSTMSRTRSGRRSADASRERRQRRGRSESIEQRLGWFATDASPARPADAPAAGLYEADESELEFEFDFDAREQEQAVRQQLQVEQVVREERRGREEERRGRLRKQELDGPVDLNNYAPGLGNGRSGLRDRASRDADRLGRIIRSPVVGLRA